MRYLKPSGMVLGVILCMSLSVCTATDAKKKETAAKVELSDVVATVNGEEILEKDVAYILKRLGNQIPEDQIANVKRQILDGLISQKLFTQFIRDNKIEVKPAAVEAEIDKVRADIKLNPSLEGKALEEVLESHGSNIDDLKKDIIISLSLEEFLGKDIDEKKLKKYFEQNKFVYDETEVKASHILVDTRGIQEESKLATAREKIDKAKAEVDKGKDFAEVAQEFSDCPSSSKGGDLGFFKRQGQMVEPFAAAAFALKAGEVSEPIETDFGYHIIKVTEIKKGKDLTFDDMDAEIIKRDIMRQLASTLLSQLKEKSKVEVKSGT
ncbi:MAG: peptidylprolyl isomerase [Candidatus Brocadiaceae bacterium]|nr:peptidylprolyl isomerase [Candidatus Brocadiaceae bacterium]